MAIFWTRVWLCLVVITLLQVAHGKPVADRSVLSESRSQKIVNDSENVIPDNERDFERALDESIKRELSDVLAPNSDDLHMDNNNAEAMNQVRRFDGAQFVQMRKSFLLYGLLLVAVTTAVVFIACYVKDTFKKSGVYIGVPVYTGVASADYDDSKRFSLVSPLSLRTDVNQPSKTSTVVCPLHASSKTNFPSP